jgi:Acyl carrier protein
MTREELFEKLNAVFRDVFDDDEIIVNEETTSKDIDGWDSLEHINLIMAIEDEFGISFNIGEVTTMKNVGAMADKIMDKIK